DAAVQLRLDLVAQVRARGEHLLDVALERARGGIDELELLFDPEGEAFGQASISGGALTHQRWAFATPPETPLARRHAARAAELYVPCASHAVTPARSGTPAPGRRPR